MELTTRQGYAYQLDKHIMEWFGPMRMAEIMPDQVREWIAEQADRGMDRKTLSNVFYILSAVFTTAFTDQVTFIQPCRGVKLPTVPERKRSIITPETFDDIYSALEHEVARLLVETDIESGLRWGELTELRVSDIDFRTGILTVTRVVIEVNPKFHPEGKRLLVVPYPKDKTPRRLKLARHILLKLEAHIQERDLQPTDLLFRAWAEPSAPKRPDPVDGDLGLTDPNDRGRQYLHGTLSAYTAGKCRRPYCRAAFADYRAQRRAAGKDSPRQPRKAAAEHDHISRGWFRINVWYPALGRAGIRTSVSLRTGKGRARAGAGRESVWIQDLRRAHASWLLAGGADIQVVKERLGHVRLSTTEGYLGTLPDADETALTALARTRARSQRAA
ncbi:hypothetical protein RB614_31320 [Phytohabitans sp. ZYX-F-186]|uniref:Tyr recombinase domain-containing protein n=1 Tax=Phytohabitans maris TaxID=3071409 RepID=A0ABU0ZRR2_9ACTN|nr:hypothetical protein [Phytohabitans sp. ZYX-F-186]MDQ7909024.1 hypothetical protein [Phytohabitans sp. ZYX-F-186]